MSNDELLTIQGGGISATYLNSLSRFGEFIYNVGKAFGSSLAGLFRKRHC